jgi:O-antigen/teichoic acid export membrane protein
MVSSALSLKLKELLKYVTIILRREPFDFSSAEGRSKERYRRVALTTLASGAAKVISILTMLISVPLTLKYLGTERYGLWMAINSVVLMLAFADLGMGNGLMNAIARAHGKDDRQAAQNYVSSAFFLLSLMSVLVLGAFALAYSFIPWTAVFNIKSSLAVREVGPAVAILVCCFALNMPLGIVQRIQMGYQEGYVNSLWQGLGSVIGLIGILLVVYLQAGLFWLVLAVGGSQVIAAGLNGLTLFRSKRPWLLPRIRSVTAASAKRILHIGLLFFVLQLAGVFMIQADNLIIAQMLGLSQVSQYAVVWQLFLFAPNLLAMALMPLWPAYGEAIARKDALWVKKTFKRSLILTFSVNIPSAIFLIAFGQQILHVWIGSQINPSLGLLIGMGVYILLNSIGGPCAMLLNGANVIKFQVVCALLAAVAKVGMSIGLARVIGLPGVIFGTVAAQVLFILLPTAWFIPRFFATIQNNRQANVEPQLA